MLILSSKYRVQGSIWPNEKKKQKEKENKEKWVGVDQGDLVLERTEEKKRIKNSIWQKNRKKNEQ